MFHLEDVLQLKDTEDVKLITRRHLMTLAPGLFLALVLIVIPFFLLFPLFSWGIFGVILFLFAVISGIVIAVRSFLLWDADVFIITTHRIVDVDQKGVFMRMVKEAQLPTIQDTSWKRHGMMETVFRMGTITIQTAGHSIEAHRIPRPELVQDLLNELRHATKPKKIDLTPERREKLRHIDALLEGFSMSELDRIESILKERERTAASDAFLAGKEDETLNV